MKYLTFRSILKIKIKIQSLLFLLYMICVCLRTCDTCAPPHRPEDIPRAELQAVMSSETWVLGIKLPPLKEQYL